MQIKILILFSITFVLIGCQDAYQRQSVLNPIGIQVSDSAQRDVETMSRGENPMARPSYQEYQESIEDKKFEAK